MLNKVGDKLTCKNKFEANDNVTFLQDVEYCVLYIDVSNTDHYNVTQVLVGNKDDNFDLFESFNGRKLSYWFYDQKVCDYFYTDKELRMIKLERLKNV